MQEFDGKAKCKMTFAYSKPNLLDHLCTIRHGRSGGGMRGTASPTFFKGDAFAD